MHFLGYYISALRGCCALKFLHALQIDRALLAHTGTGRGVPPENFNCENLKFGLKFSMLGSITSRLLGISSRNFFTVDVPQGRRDKLGTIFGRPAPKNLGGPKIVQNFARFLTTFDFDREYLRNGTTYRKLEK